MGIGLSGMISGLDTDAIVKAMVGSQTNKKNKISGNIQTNKWTTEAWSGLNKKIYNFYTSFASKLRLKSSYMTKSASSSDEKAVKVSATSSAAAGSHTLEVKALASSQYVTGSRIAGTTEYNAGSRLSAIDSSLVGTTITITGNAGSAKEKVVDFKIDEKTTIADFNKAMKDAGLTASYDSNQRRFFISSAESGTNNKFTITSSKLTADSTSAFYDIARTVDSTKLEGGELTAYNNAIDTISAKSDLLSTVTAGGFDPAAATDDEKELFDAIKTVKSIAVNQQAEKEAVEYVKNKENAALADLTNGEITFDKDGTSFKMADIVAEVRTKIPSYDEREAELAERAAKLTDYETYKAAEGDDKTEDEYNEALEEYNRDLDKYHSDFNKAVKAELYNTEGYREHYDEEVADVAILNKETPSAGVAAVTSSIDAALATMAASGRELGALSSLGLGEIDGSAKSETVDGNGNKSMVVVAASDSEVVLDGATMTGSGNTVSVNGLTIDVIAETTEPVTISVTKDTDSIYNTVKEALTEYNKLLDEMNELYYADSARTYKPLTDEQKESMSEKEIENWENKIKSALLRNDSSLGSLLSAMRTSLQSSVTTESGNTYSLASFGISTGIYTERGKLHIYGDSDDNTFATYDDRLKKALAENPDDVMEALSGIFGNLYNTMSDKCAKTTLSSALTFYNDKQYKKDLTAYEKQLSTMEEKIAKLEERYYKQFTAMEKAMATLQSQTASLSNMLGLNNNQNK